MNILMVGVDKNRRGGMWSVAETFIESSEFNDNNNLYYVATSTCGSIFRRIRIMLIGYVRIIWNLITKKIDIVHIHMAEKGSVYRKGVVVIIAKVFKKKVVVQMHAGPIMGWYETLPEINKRIVKDILNIADQLLVLGEYWKTELSILVPLEKITVLYNGVVCPTQNPYNADGRIILYLGLIKKTKGTYDLVEAICKIDALLSQDIKVYICGLDEDGEMPDYIKKKEIGERIILPGWISKNQRDKIFKETFVVVLPSYYEALSMTVIEAMANGIPVITTNISTMPELLGEDIKLIEPGDIDALSNEILKVVNNRELRIQESEKEYTRACSNFSSSVAIKRTINIYRNLCGDK